MKELVQQQKRSAPAFKSLVYAACMAAFSPCFAAERFPSYSVIPIGPAASEFEGTYMQPSSINNRGDIVGMTTDFAGSASPRAFLYREGNLRYLWSEHEPYFPYHLPAINNRGTIVGFAAAWEPDLLPPVVTFTYPVTGRSQDFNFARASAVASRWFFPWDINDRGTIVGDLRDTPFRTAAVYQHGELRVLPALSSGGEAVAMAINNRGQIIGTSGAKDFSYPFFPTRAVIWSDGRIQDLGLLPGCVNADGADINDRGEAVGSCNDVSEESGFRLGFAHGFIYRNGVMARIPTPPGTTLCVPLRINNRSQILIRYFPRLHPEVFGDGAWLFSDGVLHDLDQIVSDATGWRVIYLGLYDLNDRGQIVGVAQYDHRDGRFFTQGILITPRAHTDFRTDQ